MHCNRLQQVSKFFNSHIHWGSLNCAAFISHLTEFWISLLVSVLNFVEMLHTSVDIQISRLKWFLIYNYFSQDVTSMWHFYIWIYICIDYIQIITYRICLYMYLLLFLYHSRWLKKYEMEMKRMNRRND